MNFVVNLVRGGINDSNRLGLDFLRHLTCIQFLLFCRPQFGLKLIPQNLKILEIESDSHNSQTYTHLDVFDRESESEPEFTHFVISVIAHDFLL